MLLYYYSFTDELDLAIIPFHDQTKFELDIPHTQKLKDLFKGQVRRLISVTTIKPVDWFAELSRLFGEEKISLRVERDHYSRLILSGVDYCMHDFVCIFITDMQLYYTTSVLKTFSGGLRFISTPQISCFQLHMLT